LCASPSGHPSSRRSAVASQPQRCAILHRTASFWCGAAADGNPSVMIDLLSKEMNKMKSENVKPRLSRTALLVASCFSVLLVGCGSLSPVPYKSEEIRERVSQDRIQMYAEQEPIVAPLTFHEAAA